MRKRNKILVATIICIALLSLFHYRFGIFTPYNYFTAKRDFAKGKPRILKYGEAMLTDKQAIRIADKLGFTYDIVAGCLISTPYVNGIDHYNSVSSTYLSKKLGKDWEKRFDFLIDSLFREDSFDTIYNTAMSDERVRVLKKQLDSATGGKAHLYAWVFPQEKNKANVKVCRLMPDSSVKTYFYFKVNPYSLKAETVDQ